MSKGPDKGGQAAPAQRGEAAWKAAKAAIEARNDQARKAGRERRAAAEERRLGERRRAERRESADIDATGHRSRGTSES